MILYCDEGFDEEIFGLFVECGIVLGLYILPSREHRRVK